MTWFCRLVVLSVGAIITSVQFGVFKSEFRCRVNIMEGTVQERTAVSREEVRLNTEAGVVCDV